jgi:3-oxoacyl-[acyl-carrier protein] reductase
VAKAAIGHFTRYAARELAPHGIRVNCVAPGTATTPRVEAILSEEMRGKILALTPMGRLGTADDSANAIVFLASDAAAYLTGITLDVSGGRIMV